MIAAGRSPRIPLSPSSPSGSITDSGYRYRHPSDSKGQSPLSPVSMLAAKSYSSYGNQQNTDEMTSQPSPHSSAAPSTYTQNSKKRTSDSFSNLEPDVSQSSAFSLIENVDSHRDKRQKLRSVEGQEKDDMDVEMAIEATNHDRQTENFAGSSTLTNGDGITLDQLQEDMGEPFLLCRSTVNRSRLNPQDHLLAKFGLGSLLRAVARTDPLTGEKINKLRKSYEGQIKGFNLPGRNKPVKTERAENEPGSLRRLAGFQPHSEWSASTAKPTIQVTPDLTAKMQQAVQMQPGKVRDSAMWEEILGHEKARPPPAAVSTPSQPQINRVPNGISRPSMATISEERRKTRGKKRSYGDDSFVGYAEGFSDDNDHEGLYGTDEEGGARNKRKRESISGTGPLTYGQTIGR